MSGTKRQRNKKNKTRPKAGEINFRSSMHQPKKRAIIEPNGQTKLFN